MIVKKTKVFYVRMYDTLGFPGGPHGKESAYNAGDPGSVLGLGRCPREGNGNPFQCFWKTPWTKEPVHVACNRGHSQSMGS